MNASIIRDLTLQALFKFDQQIGRKCLNIFPPSPLVSYLGFFSIAWFVCCDPNHVFSIFIAGIVRHGVAKQHWLGSMAFSVEALSLRSKIQKRENHYPSPKHQRLRIIHTIEITIYLLFSCHSEPIWTITWLLKYPVLLLVIK